MNPFCVFVDGGNSYTCNICRFVNKTPSEYFAPLGANNTRTDKYERSELHRGCYDILAPKEYIKKPIHNILLLFCIEFTQ
jgi:protein transport protein SEC24